jgi:hypothetical protein
VFSVDCPRWASDNEGSGRLNPGTAVFRSHHAQQNPGHAREIERLNALVDSRYAECVRRLGNSPAPSQAATKAILTTSLLEGTDPTLLAVTWQKEAIPPFNFSPVSNYRPEDGGWDVGPLQTSTTYYDKSPFTDGLPNPFGTSRSETQAFNGNPYSSLRVGARALNEISSRSRGRADTAGIYRAGSRSPASYTTRFNEFNALSPEELGNEKNPTKAFESSCNCVGDWRYESSANCLLNRRRNIPTPVFTNKCVVSHAAFVSRIS